MKLWQKGKKPVDKQVEAFTVGNDYLVDYKLLKYDCIASIAHAKMLEKMRLLTPFERKKLEKEFKKIPKMAESKKFMIRVEDEDCHAAIENHLTKKLGKAGKKIHSFRSRNDQVLVALRLYSKDEIVQTGEIVEEVVNELKNFAKKNRKVKMPGYTHMQKAMPSSAGLWASAFADSLQDDLRLLESSKAIIDQNPLGSGAGYGFPVKTDRKLTTSLLGFKKTQKNPVYCANSRGKFESIIIFCLAQIMLDLNKLAVDLLLFSTKEFGYFYLPGEFYTGSSIMPQKSNPDILEILRAKNFSVQGDLFKTISTISNLPSGYNRDFQLTKEPLVNSFETTKESLKTAARIIQNLKVNKEKCRQAMTSEIFATEVALKKTLKGTPFRDAYRQAAKEIQKS